MGSRGYRNGEKQNRYMCAKRRNPKGKGTYTRAYSTYTFIHSGVEQMGKRRNGSING